MNTFLIMFNVIFQFRYYSNFILLLLALAIEYGQAQKLLIEVLFQIISDQNFLTFRNSNLVISDLQIYLKVIFYLIFYCLF